MVKQQNLSAKKKTSQQWEWKVGPQKGGEEGIWLPPLPRTPPPFMVLGQPKSVFSLLNPFFDNLLEEDNKLKTTWYNANPTPHDIPMYVGPKRVSGLYTKKSQPTRPKP